MNDNEKKQIIESIKKYELKDITFPTIEEIFGSDTCGQSKIFKEYGTKAAITDFAVVLGGFISNFNYIDNANRTGYWWTKSPYSDIGVFVVGSYGDPCFCRGNEREYGCRPVIPFSSISKICSNKKRDINDLLEVEYGEYPQWVCSKEFSIELEELYKNNKLNTTGKVYTTDSRDYKEDDKDFEPQEHIEYNYNGKKYVRVKVNSCYDDGYFELSNRKEYKDGDYVWIEVSPVKWLVDEKKDVAITKNIIAAGIQFNKEINYTGENFDEMNIKKFMDKCLSKNITPHLISEELKKIKLLELIFQKDKENRLNSLYLIWKELRKIEQEEYLKSQSKSSSLVKPKKINLQLLKK